MSHIWEYYDNIMIVGEILKCSKMLILVGEVLNFSKYGKSSWSTFSLLVVSFCVCNGAFLLMFCIFAFLLLAKSVAVISVVDCCQLTWHGRSSKSWRSRESSVSLPMLSGDDEFLLIPLGWLVSKIQKKLVSTTSDGGETWVSCRFSQTKIYVWWICWGLIGRFSE